MEMPCLGAVGTPCQAHVRCLPWTGHGKSATRVSVPPAPTSRSPWAALSHPQVACPERLRLWHFPNNSLLGIMGLLDLLPNQTSQVLPTPAFLPPAHYGMREHRTLPGTPTSKHSCLVIPRGDLFAAASSVSHWGSLGDQAWLSWNTWAVAIPESVIIGVGGLGTAAVTRAGRLWAPLILRGLDHPCNVETEAAHVELASSHVGTRRPSGGRNHTSTMWETLGVCLCLSGVPPLSLYVRLVLPKCWSWRLPWWLGSFCSQRQQSVFGRESLGRAQICTLGFTRRCRCSLNPVQRGRARGTVS